MVRAYRWQLLGAAVVVSVGLGLVAGGLFAKNLPVGTPQAQSLEGGARSFVTDRNLGADNPAWQAFEGRHPGEWKTQWDVRTGIPTLIFGPGLDTGIASLDEATVGGLAFDLIQENGALLGVEAFALEGNPVHAGTTWIVDFRLTYAGIPLEEHSRLGFRIKDNGVVAAIKSNDIPRGMEPSAPEITARAAIDSVLASLTRTTHDLTASEPTLAYLDDEAGVGRLVWRFELRNGRLEEPFAMEYFVHAREGLEILRTNDLIVYEHRGDVTAKAISGATYDPPVNILMNDARVTYTSGGSGSAYTDLNGDFVFPSGTGTATIRSRMDGRWANANNTAGSDVEQSITAGAGDNFHFLLNQTPTEFVTAETTGFLWATAAHNWSHAYMGNNGLEFELPVNVNINSTCNAYWDGSSINFYRAGGGCPNTAHDATVVVHEYGHGIDSGVGGIIDGGYSEGFGDAIAMAITDQYCAGIDFYGPGTCLRSGESVRMWPAPECGGEVHCVGEVYAQFTWQMTKNLKTALGQSAGRIKADELILLPAVANPTSIPDAVFETFVADDDDGNLENGTPNFAAIAAAADARNLPRPDNPLIVQITLVDGPLGEVRDTVNDQWVTVNVTSSAAPITTVLLRYRLNGAGNYTSVAMVATGNPDEYAASIPAQPCPTGVEYYVSAADGAGNIEQLPRGAPAGGVMKYAVARLTVSFFDNMENGTNGWTHQQIQTQDDWMLGAPNQQGDNPYDPLSAWSGSNVWGNDLNPPGYQGNYANNVNNLLRSPTINCSDSFGTTLVYRRWLSVEKGIYDQATIEVNGAVVWSNNANVDHIDNTWVEHTVDISAIADGNANVQIVFRLVSDGALTYGGWNIDDVEIRSASDCSLVVLEASDYSPAIGSPLSFTTTAAPVTLYDLYSARQLGNESVVPPGGGALVETMLGPSIRLRHSDSTDASGVDVWTKTVPSRPQLIGKTFYAQDVGQNGGENQASNIVILLVTN